MPCLNSLFSLSCLSFSHESRAMLRRLPPLNALKPFEAAARNESCTRAAEELCVTQGAVSHELSRNLGDENRLKAAYRGGCRALPEPPERSNTPCREIPRSFLSVSLMLSKIP